MIFRCAFVIPVYELSRSVEYPRTKKELIEHAARGKADPYKWHTYNKGKYSVQADKYVQSN